MRLQQKDAQALLPTDILFQTAVWGEVKSQLHWTPLAFDFALSGPAGDLLMLTKPCEPEVSVPHVPQGPECGPECERYGLFLEELSNAIRRYLHPSVAFIRYDLPWSSPYAIRETPGCSYPPEPRVQELCMNFGTPVRRGAWSMIWERSPSSDPDHRIVHRTGSWDYPLQPDGYAAFRNSEVMAQTGILTQM